MTSDPLRRFQQSLERLDCPSWMAQAMTEAKSTSAMTSGTTSGMTSARADSRRASNRQSYRQFLQSRQARANAYGNAVSNYAGHRSSSYDANIVRWSSSTLSGVTPTDSVDSCPCPPFRTGAVSRVSNGTHGSSVEATSSVEAATAAHRRPYLGWRSTDNLEQLECKAVKTPSERLLLSRSSASTASWSGLRYRSTNSLDLDASSASSASWQRPPSSASSTVSVSRPDCRGHLHESIRSVTSAIVEFCNKDTKDATTTKTGLPERRPASVARTLPTFEEFKARPNTAFGDIIVHHHDNGKVRPRQARSTSRPRVVWLESSFVSAAEPTKTKTGIA